MRGERVVVRDYKRHALVRRLWEDLGDRVVVTDEDGLRRFRLGDSHAPSVALHREDVFQFAGVEDYGGRPVDWLSMTPLPEPGGPNLS